MKYRKLDANGDYTFGGGSTDMLKDKGACAQAIKTRLLLLLAEWWEDLNEGLPLFQSILAKRNIQIAEKIIRERIEGTQHVNQITFFQSFFNNESRDYSFYAIVDTDFGEITLEEVKL